MLELTKMTSKGQVVIPSDIRKELHLEEGTQMVVSTSGDLVLMKKVTITDPKQQFERLTKQGEESARKKGIKSEADVVRMIHEYRKSKHA